MINFEKMQWLSIDKDVLKVKDFKDIRKEILEVMKEIYDYQTDIPENSSDYVFANNLALNIWNNARLVEEVFKLHNIDYASGNYLDKIAGWYGKYRLREKGLVFKVIVESSVDFINQIDFKKVYTLYDKQGNTYKFKIIQIVQHLQPSDLGFQRKQLLIGLDKYYSELKDITKWNELQIEQETSESFQIIQEKFDQKNSLDKIIKVSSQRMKQTDDELKNSIVNNKNENRRVIEEVMKLDYVKNITFMNDIDLIKQVFQKHIDNHHAFEISRILQKNTLIPIIEFEKEWWLLSNQQKEVSYNDICLTLSEFLPLGTVLTSLFYLFQYEDEFSDENKTRFNELYLHVSKNIIDTISSTTVNITISKPNYGSLVFVVYDKLKDEELKQRLNDLLDKLNDQETFFNYTLEQGKWTLALLGDLFTVNAQSTWILLDKTEENVYTSGTQLNTLFQYDWQLTGERYVPKDNWLIGSLLHEHEWIKINDEEKVKFPLIKKLSFEKYQYKYNQDGTVTVMLW